MDKTDRLRDYGLAFLLYEQGLGICGYELIRELFIFIKLIFNSYLEYRIEYDKTAFQVEYNYKFVHSEKERRTLCGADDSTVTYELTPLKKGLFDIYEVEGFRCQETARKKHTIVVI